MTTSLETKKQILAAQITQKRSKNNEERLANELGKFFAKLKDKVLSALEEYWSEYQLLQGQVDLICSPIHEAHKEYYEIIAKYKKREYKLGIAEAKRLVKNATKQYKRAEKSEITTIPLSANIERDRLFATLPAAEEEMLNKTFTASERTLARVDNQVNQIITDGYRSGKGINHIGNQLTKRFNQLETWESRRIARTEVHGSHNTAVMNTYSELGVEYTQWISHIDKRTRSYRKGDKADHVKIDREIIPLGSKYSNGLAYPGDTSGKIEEWINCRCSNAPFVIPYGYIAPAHSPFREEDLVKVSAPNFNEIISQATQTAQTSTPSKNKELIRQFGAIDKYKLTPTEMAKYQELKPQAENNKLKFLQKVEFEDLETKLNLNQLHHELINKGKLSEARAKEYKKLYNHLVMGTEEPLLKDTSSLEGKKPKESHTVKDIVGYIDINTLEPAIMLGEYKLPGHVKGIEIVGGELNSKGKDVPVATEEAINEYNKQFLPTPEIINVSDLIMSGSEVSPEYIITHDLEGFKIIGNKGYYKGLEVKNYDIDKKRGKILKYEIEKHNKDLIFKDIELPSLNEVENLMSIEFYNKYIGLKEQLEWAIDIQTSPYVSAKGKKMGLEIIENELSNFKKLNKQVLDKVQEKTPLHEELFSIDDLFDLPEDGGYLVVEDPSLLKFNEKTKEWEYKGVEVDYTKGDSVAYIDMDVAQQFLDNLDKGYDPYKLTMNEIVELDVDPQGDYLIEEHHKVIYNKETGVWEYKGVELFDYDEYDKIGVIDKNTMRKYIDENNLNTASVDGERYIPDILSIDEINGKKFIVDGSGRQWEIDHRKELEYAQDAAQHEVVFNENRKNSGMYWGHYGHQAISNLLYGDSSYTDYSRHKPKIDAEVLPLLNKMRDKFKIITDTNIDIETKQKATKEYTKLYSKFEEVAYSFDDFEVTQLLYKILDIDEIIIGSPPLLQDTALVRYGHFDESMCVVGETFNLEGFLSTSYDDMTNKPDATSHFADKPYRWKIIILAPEGTSGTRLNNQFNALTTEREWLLPREQDFKVVWHGKTSDPTHPEGERNTVVIQLPD